jgi:uncharacterized protein involved in exopolysaccharide biosynthesis
MRLKLGLLALALTALGIGIPYYLDSRIHRATAVVQFHPQNLGFQVDQKGNAGTLRTGPSTYWDNPFETIASPETLRMALSHLRGETEENPTITASDIETLKNKITAKPRRGTDFIEITVKDESRGDAIRLANAVATAFIERFNQIQAERNQRILGAVDEEVQAQEDMVQDHRKELTVLIQQYGIGHSTPLEMTENQMLENTKKRLSRFMQMRDQTKIQIRQLNALKGNDLVLYAAGLDLPENQVTYYHSQYQKALAEKRTLSGEGLNPDDDKLVAIEQQIKQLKEFMQEEITSLKTNLQTKLELLIRQIKRIEELLENKDKPNLGHSTPKKPYHRAKEAYEQSRTMLHEMKIKQQEARALLELSRDPVTLHEAAK